MREIDVSLITEAVSRACISANKVLPDDLAALIKKSADTETDDVPKDIMCRLCDNLCAAKELDIPIPYLPGHRNGCYLCKNRSGCPLCRRQL